MFLKLCYILVGYNNFGIVPQVELLRLTSVLCMYLQHSQPLQGTCVLTLYST